MDDQERIEVNFILYKTGSQKKNSCEKHEMKIRMLPYEIPTNGTFIELDNITFIISKTTRKVMLSSSAEPETLKTIFFLEANELKEKNN